MIAWKESEKEGQRLFVARCCCRMRLGREKRGTRGTGNCRRPRSAVVGEVRWQSINIQNQPRARETEGGRASERRPTIKREKEKEEEREALRTTKREGEREAPRWLRLPFVRSVAHSLVRSCVPKAQRTKLGVRTEKKRRASDARENVGKRSRRRRRRRMVGAMDRKPGSRAGWRMRKTENAAEGRELGGETERKSERDVGRRDTRERGRTRIEGRRGTWWRFRKHEEGR